MLRDDYTEKEIQQQIADYLTLCGILYSITDAGDNKGKSKVKKGWPDITAILSNGNGGHIVAAIECKTATGQLREDQEKVLEKFATLGAIVIIARSVEDVVNGLRGL